ncbi:hypothetical protein QN372_20950 [Undibacterium sp. RTI2.1]|uniref:DUF7146 domain-containing protein n=1 Tax=unclassified Undibacterium TaxID=2630295 RepID=UPI002B23B7B3|nr:MULTISPECIES: hypothetical protein [unclassified Undibacterium]MEB0033209.1 hypothetical protein [Undibacterium sp. RTI2.1]
MQLIHEVLDLSYADVFALLKGNDIVITPVKKVFTAQEDELTADEIRRNTINLKKAWMQSQWMKRNDAAWRYLQNRVPFTDLDQIDKSVRLHTKMEFWESVNDKRVMRGLLPTMLTVVKDSAGNVITLHRTYLTNKGTKLLARTQY